TTARRRRALIFCAFGSRSMRSPIPLPPRFSHLGEPRVSPPERARSRARARAPLVRDLLRRYAASGVSAADRQQTPVEIGQCGLRMPPISRRWRALAPPPRTAAADAGHGAWRESPARKQVSCPRRLAKQAARRERAPLPARHPRPRLEETRT